MFSRAGLELEPDLVVAVLCEAVEILVTDVEVAGWFAESVLVVVPVSVEVLRLVQTLSDHDPVVDARGGHLSLARRHIGRSQLTVVIVWLLGAVLELRRRSLTPLDDVLAVSNWSNW